MRHAHSFKQMTPDELHSRLQEGLKIVLIDTLPGTHFEQSHIPDARNACVYEITFLEQVNRICSDTGTPIVVYGASSNSLDSRTAAEKLASGGYSNVTILEGGLERWRQSGYKLGGTSSGDLESIDAARKLEDGKYTVLPGESWVGWTGRNSNASHYGTIQLTSGSFQLGGSSIQGSLILDMDSIENINLAGSELQHVLITHLKSDDFFFIDAYPAARFDIRSGRYADEPFPTNPNCELTGTLDLHGVQNDLSIQATVVKGDDDNLHLSAHFDMDRTLWGIIYGSSKYYEYLGKHTVFDDISIELQLVAQKE